MVCFRNTDYRKHISIDGVCSRVRHAHCEARSRPRPLIMILIIAHQECMLLPNEIKIRSTELFVIFYL